MWRQLDKNPKDLDGEGGEAGRLHPRRVTTGTKTVHDRVVAGSRRTSIDLREERRGSRPDGVSKRRQAV